MASAETAPAPLAEFVDDSGYDVLRNGGERRRTRVFKAADQIVISTIGLRMNWYKPTRLSLADVIKLRDVLDRFIAEHGNPGGDPVNS